MAQRGGLGFGIAIGVAIGAGIGVAMDNIAVGMGMGIAIGVALGVGMNEFGGKREDDDRSGGETGADSADGDGGGD